MAKKANANAGKKAVIITFRPSSEVQEYLAAEKAKGERRTTDTILKALRITRDLATELGDDWWEVERRANVEELSIGLVLARLVAPALRAEARGKR